MLMLTRHLFRDFRRLFLFLPVLTVACSDLPPGLPSELALKKILYTHTDVNPVGQGSMNQSFIVFQLQEDVSGSVKSNQLDFLNTLPSTMKAQKRMKPPKVWTYEYQTSTGPKTGQTTGPWRGPFKEWHATPIATEGPWHRTTGPSPTGQPSALATFYKDTDFLSGLSNEFMGQFYDAIQSKDSFYAYGGYRGESALIISPSQGYAYYLFRD